PCVSFGLRRLPSPLPQKASVTVKDHDTTVAVAIGHIHVAGRGIHRDACGSIQKHMTRVRGRSLGSAVRGVELSPGPDLEQHFASVMRVFLNDPILATTNPQIALPVDEAAVQLRSWEYVPIS